MIDDAPSSEDFPPESVDAEEAEKGEARQLPRPSNATPLPYVRPERRLYHVVHRSAFVATSHRGPLPTAQYLREIKEIVPNGAERIMAMAEKNAEHRRQMEAKELDATIGFNKGQLARSSWGLGAALLTAIAFLAASTYLIHGGHDVAGSVLGTVDLVGLVSVFVIQRIHPSHESKPEEAGDSQANNGSPPGETGTSPEDAP